MYEHLDLVHKRQIRRELSRATKYLAAIHRVYKHRANLVYMHYTRVEILDSLLRPDNARTLERMHLGKRSDKI